MTSEQSVRAMQDTGLYCKNELIKRFIATVESVAKRIESFGAIGVLNSHQSLHHDGMTYTMATLPDGSILDCLTPQTWEDGPVVVKWYKDGQMAQLHDKGTTKLHRDVYGDSPDAAVNAQATEEAAASINATPTPDPIRIPQAQWNAIVRDVVGWSDCKPKDVRLSKSVKRWPEGRYKGHPNDVGEVSIMYCLLHGAVYFLDRDGVSVSLGAN